MGKLGSDITKRTLMQGKGDWIDKLHFVAICIYMGIGVIGALLTLFRH